MQREHLLIAIVLLCSSLRGHCQTTNIGGLFPKMPAATNAFVVDCQKNSESSKMTAWALQGLINRQSAEVYVVNNPQHLEQLEFCKKAFQVLEPLAGNDSGLRTLFQKYQARVKKMFVCDPKQDWTWYLALMAAAQQDGIPVTESIRNELTSEFGWKGNVEDFRDKWTNRIAAYDWALAHLMPGCTKRVVFVPKFGTPIMDYVAATRGFAFRLDFKTEEAEIKKIFRSKNYSVGTSLMGYAGDWANATANLFGIGYAPGNRYANGSFWSSFPNKSHTQPPGKAIKAEPGKIYASIMWSDGDNLTFDQNTFFKFWHDPNRGKVPVATALNPSLQELNPPLLDWYYENMTDNDELMTGANGVQFIFTADFNESLYPAWCRLNRLWCAGAGFHSARNVVHVNPSVKYSTYMTTCGFDGVIGAGWAIKAGFPPQVEAHGALGEQKLYEEFTKVKPNPKAPMFVNFTATAQDFDHKDSGYSAIKRQVDRLEEAYPGRYVFLLPKDQFATIKAYYDSLDVKQVEGRPDHADGLTAVKSGDGKFTIVERDGARCWLVPKQTPAECEYVYLDVEDRFRPKPGQTLEIGLEYLDVGSGQVPLEYDSYDIRAPLGGAYKQYPYRLRRANTGKWQTARFYLKDAGFGGSQNDGADFRFHNEGDDLLIRAVRVRRVER